MLWRFPTCPSGRYPTNHRPCTPRSLFAPKQRHPRRYLPHHLPPRSPRSQNFRQGTPAPALPLVSHLQAMEICRSPLRPRGTNTYGGTGLHREIHSRALPFLPGFPSGCPLSLRTLKKKRTRKTARQLEWRFAPPHRRKRRLQFLARPIPTRSPAIPSPLIKEEDPLRQVAAELAWE